MQCPNCGYVRKPEDLSPEWQCPACQMAYNKISQRNTHPYTGRNVGLSGASREPGSGTGTVKTILLAVLLGSALTVGYVIAKDTSFIHSFGSSSQDNKELLDRKRAELEAYEGALQNIEANMAQMKANVGTCPITGQPNQLNITEDPRAELQSKIDRLREEIKHLERKS